MLPAIHFYILNIKIFCFKIFLSQRNRTDWSCFDIICLMFGYEKHRGILYIGGGEGGGGH